MIDAQFRFNQCNSFREEDFQMKSCTLHPQKFGCTPKNEGKRVHVPPDGKTCGHAEFRFNPIASEKKIFLYFPNMVLC